MEEEYEVIDETRVVSAAEYAQFLEFKKQELEEGSISFALPKRVGWGVVGTMAFFIVQGVIWTTVMYNSQSNFNDKIIERVHSLEDEHNALVANTYSRREEDLRYDNLKLELLKNKEMLDIVSSRLERGKDVSK